MIRTKFKPKQKGRSPQYAFQNDDRIYFLGDRQIEVVRGGVVYCRGACDWEPEPKPLKKKAGDAPAVAAPEQGGDRDSSKIPPGAKWITVNPHDIPGQGIPLLIMPQEDGSASVIGGAGGSLNLLKLRDVGDEASWKEKAKKRKEKKKAEDAAKSDEEKDEEKQTKRKVEEAKQESRRGNALETLRTLQQYGIEHGLSDEAIAALQMPPEPDADRAEIRAWQDTVKEATQTVRAIHQAYESKLVNDHTARAAAQLGDFDNLLAQDSPHQAIAPSGDELSSMVELGGGQWLVKDADGNTETFDDWRLAANQHLVNVEAAESESGDRTQPEQFYAPSEWIAKPRDEQLPEGFEFKTEAALAIAQLSAQRKEADKAAGEIAKGKSPLEAIEGIAARVQAITQADVVAKLEANAKTLEDAWTNSDFLAMVEEGGDPRKIRRHVQIGGYGKLAEIASEVLKQNPLSRDLIDALGHNESAKLLSYLMRQTMTDHEFNQVAGAIAGFHADTSANIAAATQKQVEPMADRLKDLHEEMLSLDELAGGKLSPQQQIQMDTLAHDARTLHEAIQQKLGTTLGGLQASAAMSAAMGSGVRSLKFTGEAAEKLLDKLMPTDDDGNPVTGIFDAYGMTEDDFKTYDTPNGQGVQILESGLKKLAVGYNPEDTELYEKSIAIKRGDYDEENFVPTGFSHYAAASFSDGVSEAAKFDTTFDILGRLAAGEGASEATLSLFGDPEPAAPESISDQEVEDGLRSYIGARVANGENPLDVMSDVRSPEFYMKQNLEPYGEGALRVQGLASDLVKRVAGGDGDRISDRQIIDSFQELGDAEASKQRRARSTDDLEALHSQSIDHETAVEAGHRTLASMPLARTAFKGWGDLSGKERRMLREYGITEVLGQELQKRDKKPTREEKAQDLAEDQYDIFGNKISASEVVGDDDEEELSQWQQFSKLMGGDEKAYASVRDHLRGKFLNKFANAYGAISGKPPLIGGERISHVDKLLLAKMPEEQRNEMLEFMRQRDSSDRAKVRSRTGGKFSAEVDPEWMAKYEEVKGNNRQISLLTADTGRSGSSVDFNRTTLGKHAETMLHDSMQQVIGNFDQINDPVKMIPEVNWSKGTAHVTKQRVLKMLETNKKIGLHAGAGCVHGSTHLRCHITDLEMSFSQWHEIGKKPFVKAYDETSKCFVITEASAVFTKGKAQMYRVVLAHGAHVICTLEHQFLTPEGWQPLSHLYANQKAAIAYCDTYMRFDEIARIGVVDEAPSLVYDITVPQFHNYVAQGIIHHNSGKTATMLGSFTHLHAQGKIKKMIVAVPSSIVGQFVGEAATFLEPGKYNYNANLGWSREQRLKAYSDPNNHIHITTRESLTNDMMHLVEKHKGIDSEKFRALPEPDQKGLIMSACKAEGIEPENLLLALDEAHDATPRGNLEKSKRSLVFSHLGGHSAYYLQSTADATKNDASEMYHFLNSVAPEKFNDQQKFMAEYGANTDTSRRSLQRAIAPYSFAFSTKPQDKKTGRTLKMNEYQPKVKVNDHIAKERQSILDHVQTLSDWQSQKRDDLKAEHGPGYQPSPEDFADGFDDPAVRAAVDRLGSDDTWHALSDGDKRAAIGGQIMAIGGLKRVALDRLYHQSDYENNPKMQWTVDHAVKSWKEKGEAGVIFSASSRAGQQLVDALKKKGLRVGYIHGGLSAEQKDGERLGFQPGPGQEAKYDVLVATDAARTGVTLTRGKYLVQYDVPQTEMGYSQRSARIHRLGQDQDTAIYTPQLDTPEERIAWARMQRKGKAAHPFKSNKAELIDDTGLARRIRDAKNGDRASTAA